MLEELGGLQILEQYLGKDITDAQSVYQWKDPNLSTENMNESRPFNDFFSYPEKEFREYY